MFIEKIQNSINKDEWNKTILKYSSKTIYHSYEWLEFIEESQNIEKTLYGIYCDEKLEGFLPGFTIKKGPVKIFGSPFPGWTTPYMGPLVNDTIQQDLLLKEFKNVMKEDGYHYAELSNRILNIDIAKKEGFIISNGVTYIADIKPNPEEILASYNKTTRKCVRKAMRNGLIVEDVTDSSFIDNYYALLEMVFLKSNMKPTYTKERVKLLVKKLLPENKALLTCVKYGSNIIATRIDILDGFWMNSFGSSSSKDYLYLYPNELARFHAMCIAAERGVTHYDMTGGGTYKAKFGGVKTPTYSIIYDRFGLYGVRNLAKNLIKYRNKIDRLFNPTNVSKCIRSV